MTTGEVIALLCKHASSLNGDDLLMAKGIDRIDVFNDHIEIYFSDGNTQNYALDKEGVVTNI